MVLGSRAYFNVEESVLSIKRVQETDAGQYKCRIDFERFPTKNYVVNLSVIGESRTDYYHYYALICALFTIRIE